MTLSSVARLPYAPVQRRGEYDRIRLALSRSAHFAGMTPAGQERLAGMAQLRHVRHGERLGRAGTVDENLWIVVSGAVRISTRPQDSRREVVHAVLGDGSYFGLANAVGTGPYTFDARAFGPSDLAVVDGKRLAPIFEQHPTLWRYVTRLMSQRLKLVIGIVEDNRVLPLAERIARRLLGHAASSEVPEGSQPTLRMTQNDLARMLDAGRSRTNTALKRMETQGMVRTGYRTITLVDVPALKKLAGREVEAF
jgi:CRP/FNR family cyclic AMP-dependent transcriptional regulator